MFHDEAYHQDNANSATYSPLAMDGLGSTATQVKAPTLADRLPVKEVADTQRPYEAGEEWLVRDSICHVGAMLFLTAVMIAIIYQASMRDNRP